MIFNINQGVFGGPLRNGDLVGVCNVIEFLRKTYPTTKFYMQEGSINSADHSQKFFKFLVENTNYFSLVKGETSLNWNKVNLWDFRDISGDLVKIPNTRQMKKKIVIFPLFDAPYNVYRNWPIHIFLEILKSYSTDYIDYEKIICISDINLLNGIDIPIEFSISTNFIENIYHIMDSEIFIGGDTGTSHFASALDRSPKETIFYYSSRGLLHTTPFYSLAKGNIKTYWLNCEGTTF